MENKIKHRLTKPSTPQTNGMVERFNGGIADILKTIRVNQHAKITREKLESTLKSYQFVNEKIRHLSGGLWRDWRDNSNPIKGRSPYCFLRKAKNRFAISLVLEDNAVVT